jgi:hypothetical protein
MISRRGERVYAHSISMNQSSWLRAMMVHSSGSMEVIYSSSPHGTYDGDGDSKTRLAQLTVLDFGGGHDRVKIRTLKE